MSAAEQSTPKASGVSGWVRLVLLILGALAYLYAVVSAIVHMVSLASLADGLTPLGWGVLTFSAVLPVLVLLIAVSVGRKRSIPQLLLVLVVGLGIVAAFRVSVIAYSILNIGAFAIVS